MGDNRAWLKTTGENVWKRSVDVAMSMSYLDGSCPEEDADDLYLFNLSYANSGIYLGNLVVGDAQMQALFTKWLEFREIYAQRREEEGR